MKYTLIFWQLLFFNFRAHAQQPVFRNPGIPGNESFEITDHLDDHLGWVTAKINVELKDDNGQKHYYISVNEGNVFLDQIEVNYNDLTTVSEKRTDLRNNKLVESFTNQENKKVHFYNSDQHINKDFQISERNIYSRYAYFFSFRGFPFDSQNSVNFKSYMVEYGGNALTMKVTRVTKQVVAVKAGTFDCYKLELSVAGWQSIFASDKFYLYFASQSPHQFIKYEEKGSNGKWNANELLRTF